MSFLLKLYKYRQTEKINQLENYCTETLCYCLQHDKVLLTSLLKTIDESINPEENYTITTQVSFYDLKSRPDLLIESGNHIIFVECKLESPEGKEQLSKYANVLTDNYAGKKKYLLYLTKYRDKHPHERIFEGVPFTNILWSELCDSIQKEKNDHFTIELKTFIHNTIMKKIKSVSSEDILALKNIGNILEGFDGFFNDYRENLNKNYPLDFTKSNLVKNFLSPNSDSCPITDFKLDDYKGWLWFGIYISDEGIMVSVEFATNTTDREGKMNIVLDKLQENNAKSYDDIWKGEDYKCYYFFEPLDKFVGVDISALKNWYDEKFEIIFNAIKSAGLTFLPINA